MKSHRLLIFGASGHGRVVADAARAAGWELVGWGDGDPAKDGREIAGAKVLAHSPQGAATAALREGWQVVVGIGDNRTRQHIHRLFEDLGVPRATIIHPRAVVAPSARVGPGTVILAGAVINPDTHIGVNAVVNTAASADHDNRLEDHCHLSPGVHLGGNVTVGCGAHLGVGVCAIQGVRIGSWSVLGAGAVIVRDIPSRVVAYGIPAQVRREISEAS